MDMVTILLGNANGMTYSYAVDALPKHLRPRPGTGLLCPNCGRKLATVDGYIRHAVGKHGTSVSEVKHDRE